MSLQWQNVADAFKNRVQYGKIVNDKGIIDPLDFLEQCKLVLVLKIGELMHNFKSPVKIVCDLVCEYVIMKQGVAHITNIYHKSKMVPITISVDFDTFFDDNVGEPIKKKLDEFQVSHIFLFCGMDL